MERMHIQSSLRWIGPCALFASLALAGCQSTKPEVVQVSPRPAILEVELANDASQAAIEPVDQESIGAESQDTVPESGSESSGTAAVGAPVPLAGSAGAASSSGATAANSPVSPDASSQTGDSATASVAVPSVVTSSLEQVIDMAALQNVMAQMSQLAARAANAPASVESSPPIAPSSSGMPFSMVLTPGGEPVQVTLPTPEATPTPTPSR